MKFIAGGKAYRIFFNNDTFDLYEINAVTDKDSVNFGKEVEKIVGYFTDFNSLFVYCVKQALNKKNDELETFKDVNETITKTKAEFKELLNLKG